MAVAKKSLAETRQVTLAQARERILFAMQADIPVFIWGASGIGKSDSIHQLAAAIGGVSFDVRMANMQPTDIVGIPFFNKTGGAHGVSDVSKSMAAFQNAKTDQAKFNELIGLICQVATNMTATGSGTMDWAPPVMLPNAEQTKQYKKCILFLDEFNTAPPAVQASAYQLVLDRRAGTYRLPDNVVIIAAGNRENDQGVTYKMPAPLRNRMIHMEVKVDFESWMDWATGIGNQHPEVVSFIWNKKDALSDFDPSSASRAFASPRSWSFASKLLYQAQAGGADESIITDLIAGAVGEGLATAFMAWRRIGQNLPAPEKILNGDVTVLKNKDISAQYSLMMSLNYELRENWHNNSTPEGQDSTGKPKRKWKSDKAEKTWMSQADNFMSFVQANFEPELAVMGARIALKQYSLPVMPGKLKSFPSFTSAYGKYITDAGK